MADAGIHPDMLSLFVNLNTNAVRFIKISNTFGEGIRPFNALGQGDPWVLLVAILYVSTQFKMLQEVAPQVRGSAVIDDRTLHGPEEQVDKALRAVFAFDNRAGHITHPEKITLATPFPAIKRKALKWVYDGHKPRFETTQRMVGDVVTVLKNGANALPTQRLNHGVRTAARIKAIDCSKRGKSHALRTVAIPSMPGPAEERPRIDSADKDAYGCQTPYEQVRRTARALYQGSSTGNRGKNLQDKLLIGPVKGVLMSATDLFKKVLVGEGDIFLYPHHGPVCRLLSDSKAHVKAFMREAARQMVWDRLAEQMEESQPRRKDLAGMTDLVNVKATMAPSKLDPPSNAVSKRLWKQLHLTLVSGSMVAGDRMFAMKRAETDVCVF